MFMTMMLIIMTITQTAVLHNDKPGCRLIADLTWAPELVYNSNVYDRVINLDLISSFHGWNKYTYD